MQKDVEIDENDETAKTILRKVMLKSSVMTHLYFNNPNVYPTFNIAIR